MDYPPFSLVDYKICRQVNGKKELFFNRNAIVSFIREKTGWDSRREINEKRQLKYLFDYLEKDHINAKTVIIENDYVDKHYLEDYAEYYVRCFENYSRICSRIHFFDQKISEKEFLDALNSKCCLSRRKLEKSYLGFVVIRPIANTFLAKICIRPYKRLVDNNEYCILKKDIFVSLFGISLKVETIPLLEQDKVVAACATSSIWTMLNASKHLNESFIPSASAITKSSGTLTSTGSRIFPSTGLRTEQISTILKNNGLEPIPKILRKELYQGVKLLEDTSRSDFAKDHISLVKEHCYSYLSNEIPLLLGGTIYEKNTNSVYRALGKHLVCVLGYQTNKSYQFEDKNEQKLASHKVQKLYAHDDRYGPYSRISLELAIVNYESENGENEKLCGLRLHHEGREDDLFVPDLLLVGVYHKIRITHSEASRICRVFHSEVSKRLAIFNTIRERLTSEQESSMSFYETFKNSIFDIHLTENNKEKLRLIKTKDWYSSCYGDKKSDFLSVNMPRYIWRCGIIHEGVRISDYYLDATGVLQGQVIIGYVSYQEIAEQFWQQVGKDIRNNEWEEFYDTVTDPDERSALRTIMKYFLAPESDISLNALYGPLRYPNRNLKPGEEDDFENIKKRSDLISIARDNQMNLNQKLKKQIKYIWVINKYGDFVVGEDIEEPDGFQGHPTLIDGAPARLGGELLYDQNEKKWLISTKSGTYSYHLVDDPNQASIYLTNLINRKFPEQDVSISPGFREHNT